MRVLGNKESNSIASLLQPLGGLLGEQVRFQARSDEPRFITRVVQLGDLGQVWDHVPKKSMTGNFRPQVEGVGVGLDDEDSMVPAFGEALERYCTCVYTPEQFVWATADELDKDALDLETIPRCSRMELSRPRCPLVAPNKQARIRWIRGTSLLSGKTIYVPVVMVYLYAGFACREERFWLPITTGCAAHTSYERALLSAILEVIERDAISIIWLQQLGLPRIEVDRIPVELEPYWDRLQKSSKELEYVFFDGTSDLGVPTVYGLQISKLNPRQTTLVSCSTAMTPTDALIKVIRDMAQCRVAFRSERPTPETWEDFTEIFHGARYMARAEQAHAFNFLLQSGRKKFLSDIAPLEATDDQKALRTILKRIRCKEMEAYAVDLSTDEALRVGAKVVRVLMPSLQPLSFHYRARYLGHPRLYEAPKKMGYSVHQETQLNYWPQPFA